MKETKICIIALLITCLIIVSCAYAMPAQAESCNPNFGEFYPRLSVVVERQGDKVICQDQEGNLWSFFCDESDEWNTGDLCNLLMWNSSEDVTEHEVIEVYREIWR